MDDLFSRPTITEIARRNGFPDKFLEWLPENNHIWLAFVEETMKVIHLGFEHYSARTIIHFLRHHSALTEKSLKGFKINDHHSPYLGRLFDIIYPEYAGLWEKRTVKSGNNNEVVDNQLKRMLISQ